MLSALLMSAVRAARAERRVGIAGGGGCSRWATRRACAARAARPTHRRRRGWRPPGRGPGQQRGGNRRADQVERLDSALDRPRPGGQMPAAGLRPDAAPGRTRGHSRPGPAWLGGRGVAAVQLQLAVDNPGAFVERGSDGPRRADRSAARLRLTRRRGWPARRGRRPARGPGPTVVFMSAAGLAQLRDEKIADRAQPRGHVAHAWKRYRLRAGDGGWPSPAPRTLGAAGPLCGRPVMRRPRRSSESRNARTGSHPAPDPEDPSVAHAGNEKPRMSVGRRWPGG